MICWRKAGDRYRASHPTTAGRPDREHAADKQNGDPLARPPSSLPDVFGVRAGRIAQGVRKGMVQRTVGLVPDGWPKPPSTIYHLTGPIIVSFKVPLTYGFRHGQSFDRLPAAIGAS